MQAKNMQERPILFSGLMVQAILRGEKTQTRRIVKCLGGIRRGDQWAGLARPESGRLVYRGGAAWSDNLEFPPSAPIAKCPYGEPGCRLWVRETFAPMPDLRPIPRPEIYDGKPAWYRADNDRPVWAGTKWTPAIHMPRSCARIVLQITGVRVEQVRFISDEDAVAEGVADRGAFGRLWESINGPDSWDWNPWVWVVEFERLQPAAR